MTRLSRFVIVAAVACLPLLARAEGKCNDDPFDLNGKLAVAWTIPLPDGDVPTFEPPGTQANPTLMEQLDQVKKIEPSDFPPDYDVAPWRFPYPDYPSPGSKKFEKFNDETSHAAWLQKLKLPQDPNAVPISQQYVKDQRRLFGFAVTHPEVPDKKGYDLCTCILQRAVLLWDDVNQKEYVWLRSRFRSARKDGKGSTIFEPNAAIKFGFSSPRIWFPLAYNHVLPQPPAFLVLDIVTKKKLPLVNEYSNEDLGQISYQLGATPQTWNVTRLRRRFDRGTNPADLSILPPP